jgi:hypothetical protein
LTGISRQKGHKNKNEALRFYATMAAISSNGLELLLLIFILHIAGVVVVVVARGTAYGPLYSLVLDLGPNTGSGCARIAQGAAFA